MDAGGAGAPPRAGRRLQPVLAAAILAGAAARLLVSKPDGLWEDEIIAVTHAVQPLPRLLVQVLRHDIHPPLYFLQLHVWSLAGRSDLWFAANSVVWGLAALASIHAVLRARGGALRGAAGAAFLAVLPAGLWMSQEVRPYAWLSVLLIWAYAFALRSFAAPQAGGRNRSALLLISVAMAYSHAIGFLAVLFNGLFALGLLAGRRAPARDYRGWAAVYGLSALASLPVLASNLAHDANLGGPASAADVAGWFSDVVTAQDAHGWALYAGLLAYAVAAVAGLAVARTRLTAACFLVAPMLAALGLEAAVKPVFKINFFAAMLAPFLAVVLADLCLAAPARVRRGVAGAALAALFALSLDGYLGRPVSTGYLSAARDIRAEGRPGDVIYAPQLSMFLGMAWYLDGPGWGSPLEVSNPPNAQWRAVYARLGPDLVERLHLMPKTQTLATPDGLKLMVGDAAMAAAEEADRVWLVTYPRADLPAGLPGERFGGLARRQARTYSLMTVTLYERPGAAPRP